MSILFYKRPDYIARPDGPLDLSACQKYVERTKHCKTTIPPEISFDNIIERRTLPPCSIQDFMDYLVYITHDAENLQFYLWLTDYTRRFGNAPRSEQCLSPIWNFQDAPPTLGTGIKATERTLASMGIREISVQLEEEPLSDDVLETLSLRSSVMASSKLTAASVAEANSQAGLKWQAFTVQPFRSEITRIISHYIAPGSPRELNLSHKDRASTLHALQHTTHPSAFAHLHSLVELTLRNQSHPNFIRWSICNGNQPRVFFLRGFAVMNISLGFLIAVLLTLSTASRWWRIFAAIEWWFGITNLVAAYKGLCVLLHRMHTRNIRPWELDSSETDSVSSKQQKALFLDDEENGLSSPRSPTAMVYSLELKSSNFPPKLYPFGSPNDFENEPWVEKWKGQSLWKRIDAKKVWVQEEGLRIVQNKIVKQAHAWGALITLPLTVVFVALPKGNLY